MTNDLLNVQKKKLHIVGAGFSGLSLGYRFAKMGYEVHIYDERSSAGGMIQTLPLKLGFAETAAVSISETDRLIRLLDELNMPYLRPQNKKRLFYRGSLSRWPLDLTETLSMIFKAIPHFISGTWKPFTNESLKVWGDRVFGKCASFHLIQTAMQGIYAGDPQKLSASLLLSNLIKPKSQRIKHDKLKGLITFPNGMSELIQCLEAKIIQNGGQFHWQTKVDLENLRHSFPNEAIAICASAKSTSVMLQKLHPELSQNLSQIEALPIMSITATWPNERSDKSRCLGTLASREQNVRALGVLMNDSLSPRGWNFSSETWIYGGATDPTILNYSDHDLRQILHQDRRKILDLEHSPLDEAVDFNITRWPQGLPHYDLKLEQLWPDILVQIKQLEQNSRIYLNGNYLNGIGLSKILSRSETMEIT